MNEYNYYIIKEKYMHHVLTLSLFNTSHIKYAVWFWIVMLRPNRVEVQSSGIISSYINT